MIETGHTDTLDTTSLHVPDLGLIVSGDVAYNCCHMYVGATTPDSRAEWVAALERAGGRRAAAGFACATRFARTTAGHHRAEHAASY